MRGLSSAKTRGACHRAALCADPLALLPAHDGPELMQKQSVFHSPLLPCFLLVPQVSIVLVFFYWPAVQAVWQSFLLQDAFGLSTDFVWFENYIELLSQPEYFNALVRTFAFSAAIVGSSLSFA